MPRRIAIISIAPLFPDSIYGGSQAILSSLAAGLGRAGAAVDLICTARPENEDGFDLAPGVRVQPILRLAGTFPDPYEVPPASLSASARAVRPFLESADAIYLHADIFHFRSLIPGGVPVVRSFHDFHYETALVSAFAYGADLTITPSRYVARCIAATVGASGLRRLEPIRVIPNGIDLEQFAPGGESGIDGLAPRRPGDLVILHPHRPDARKGIYEALDVTRRVSELEPSRRVRLVVPRHLDAKRLPFMASQYRDIKRRAEELGLSGSLEFVEWVPRRMMGRFYRYGDITLCLGNIIEAFGLTPYESVACGTPVVAASVGAYRELPSLPGFHRVDYGDLDAAVAALRKCINGSGSETSLPALPEKHSEERMVAAYVDAILTARSRAEDALPGPEDEPGSPAGPLVMAPWCHAATGRIYDDYAYGYRDLPALAEYLAGTEAEWSFFWEDLLRGGVPAHEIKEALRNSVLVPDFGRG